MSNPAVAAIFALVGGIVLFVANQLVQKLVLDPLQEQSRTIAEITVGLVRWARVYVTPRKHPQEQSQEADDASEGLRLLAARLLASTHMVWGYPTVSKVLRVPPIPTVQEAAKELIFLSNSIYYPPENVDPKRGSTNRDAANHVRRLLGITVTI